MSVTRLLLHQSKCKRPNFPSCNHSMASPPLSATRRNLPEHPAVVSNKDLCLLSQAKSQVLCHISMARTNQVRTPSVNTINMALASTTNTLLLSTISILPVSRASSLRAQEPSRINTRRLLHHTHRAHHQPTPNRNCLSCLILATRPCHQQNPQIDTTAREVGLGATISALTADQEPQTL